MLTKDSFEKRSDFNWPLLQSMALNSLIRSPALKTLHDAEDTNVFCVGLQGLSEAKMELRRKEHAIRQVSKQMSYMESEKNALVDRLGDAERAMTADRKSVV